MLFICSYVEAKKLKIYKCILPNNTIAFQEKKCDVHTQITDVKNHPAKPDLKPQEKRAISRSSLNKKPTAKTTRKVKQRFKQHDLPGFVRHQLTLFKASILKPINWSTLSFDSKYGHSYVVAKETSNYQTGVKITGIKNTRYSLNITPFDAAINFFREIKNNTNKTILETGFIEDDIFKKFFVKYKSIETSGKGMIFYTVYWINENNSSLYVVEFKSPEHQWHKNWPTTELIVKSLRF
ncbi:MAG: hypothetical protein L3J52_05595 [Proteobacteria bacterium]|nr:hypothetical protein [Pseudomonadota bacterium]